MSGPKKPYSSFFSQKGPQVNLGAQTNLVLFFFQVKVKRQDKPWYLDSAYTSHMIRTRQHFSLTQDF